MLQKSLFTALAAASSALASTSSSKRGLIYIANSDHAGDDSIWTQSGSDLTWYYNYGYEPTASLKSTSLQFVPMLWGATEGDTSTAFLDSVRAQISSGANISHVLAFNEPDGQGSTGGSSIPADLAASEWKRQIEPLKQLGVKLGAPAVTGSPTGYAWLQNFFTECAGGCSADFLPLHWYGNFEGFASHLGQAQATYPNMSEFWVTEWAFDHQSLEESQSFFNQSVAYMDGLENVTHYSYFGSFRSSVSNVGANVAMLNSKGKLTDIGGWYLGKGSTGVKPDSAAGRSGVFAGWSVLVCLASVYALL